MQRQIHYVLSSHWDREWYQTFQNFRYNLVELIDNLIANFESGELKGPFQTDGQFILIEDYLQVRPENKDKIKKLIRAGKLITGPWYTMPDEFLVSGEALLRNLEMGSELCRNFGGKPSISGFVCDIFGHCNQLPQIFKLFNIGCAFIWRGLNVSENREVIWQGADGTRLATYVFGPKGYGEFAFKVRCCMEHNTDQSNQKISDNIENYIKEEIDAASTNSILMFDGCDHQHLDIKVYNVLQKYFEKGFNGNNITHTSLDDYVKDINREKSLIKKEIYGELREPGIKPEETFRNLLAGVLSSRVPLKQQNAKCQNLLCHSAEPLALMANTLLDVPFPTSFLEIAWKWLLKNHAHDSICGCSIDRVHRDMVFRFNQCLDIAERLSKEAMKEVASTIARQISDNELSLVLFNPIPRDIETVNTVTLNIPCQWWSFRENGKFEKKTVFRIYDENNCEVDYQLLSISKKQSVLYNYKNKTPQRKEVYEVKIALPVFLPSMGYKSLIVKSLEDKSYFRGLTGNGLAKSHNSMENEYFIISINANGSFDVYDKRTGSNYKNQLVFEDSADIGDGWDNCTPINNISCSSFGSSADIAILNDGPLTTSYMVSVYMNIPVKYDYEQKRRSEELVQIKLENILTLSKNSAEIEIETRLNNLAQDHRLRIKFNTKCKNNNYISDVPFNVIERPVCDNDTANTYLRELRTDANPQQSWTAIHDNQSGLAVISEGLHESSVISKDDSKFIALTLFRATGNTVFGQKEPDGQLKRPLSFRYRLKPLTGKPNYAYLCEEAVKLSIGTQYVQLNSCELQEKSFSKKLSPQNSLFKVVGNAVITSTRRIADGWEIRLFNPEMKNETVQLIFNETVVGKNIKVFEVDCVGSEQCELSCKKDNKIVIDLSPAKILTLKMLFKEKTAPLCLASVREYSCD